MSMRIPNIVIVQPFFQEKMKKVVFDLLHSRFPCVIFSIWIWKSNIKAELQPLKR